MKKTLLLFMGIPLLLLACFILKYVVHFVFETVFGIVLLKDTASTNLPNWLSWLFDAAAGIIVAFGLLFRQNEKRFELAKLIISCVIVVVASHIATYSWVYFAIACLALLAFILRAIRKTLESKYENEER